MTTRLAPGTYFGTTPRRLDLSGLTIAETTYKPGHDVPEHDHANAFFYYVVEGVCVETCRGLSRACAPSTLVFHPAGHPHSNVWRGEVGRALHIEIMGARAESLRTLAPALDRPLEFRGGMATWLARRLHREFLGPDPSHLSMEGLTLEILAEAARDGAHIEDRTTPPWLRHARELLHERFSGDHGLRQIAAEVDIHPVHLSRAFRRHYGCTPGDYARRLKIEFACRQLSSTDLPLSHIALSAGYADQSHLTRAFRLRMGMTPGEFRRHSRQR